jgi:membrane-bound inhibitor of C-type lysozyme
LAAGITAVVIGGGSYGIVAATSSGSTTTASSSTHSGTTSSGTNSSGFPLAGGSKSGGGSNARSGPAAGGSIGTVSSVSTSGFTLTTSGSQKETIKETSSTTYEKGTSQASVSAVTSGQTVLVLGTTDSKTITATQVIVNPPSSNATSPGGQTISYSKGTQGSTQTVGTIPAGYSQGAGTIVSGTTADQATEAALAVYPGGVVDRVVSIGGGDYEVHNIGVNWPHHIFVNSDFQVIGAND